jgi:ABC-type transporter Mla maintaining outer membrane lipid asymmetry ATPase subunit MlaF
VSVRTATVGIRFGIPLSGGSVTIVERTRLALGPGRIVLFVGPSGSGKSTALAELERQFAGGCMVQRVSFPADVAILDRVAPWASLGEALSTLTSCGLGEAALWLRPFEGLSEGEKFRARLARAIALHSRGTVVRPPLQGEGRPDHCSQSSGTRAPLMCDEFCASLHRRAAKAISFCLRKLVTKRCLSVVLACANEDVIADLQPDLIVWFRGRGRCDVEERKVQPKRPPSFRRRLRIEQGSKRDYDAFAAMHYRATDELGFVDKTFVMRDGAGGEPLGIVVYSHGPLELALRNQATEGLFSRNATRVNRSLRILRRLVIHPDVRGCGLGHFLVRRTLPLVGTEYVECLASMGEFNPVFEKAGMQRIGQYGVSRRRQAALDALRGMGVDPNGREFMLQVCRRRRVREIVSRVVYDWYAATTGGGERRVERQSPEFLAQTFRGIVGSRPVYYLWHERNVNTPKRQKVKILEETE